MLPKSVPITCNFSPQIGLFMTNPSTFLHSIFHQEKNEDWNWKGKGVNTPTPDKVTCKDV
jgi:hypothetical protein